MNKKLNGKKIFVTGADGFIGSHLVELLVKQGANVRALVLYNSWNEIGWLKDLSKTILNEVEVVPGDVRDGPHMGKLVKGCEHVMHLSSLIGIPYSYDAPRSYVETNIGGALNILEACRSNDSLIRLVHVSTSEVYGSAQYSPIDENHPKVGQSPYSASKIGADKLAQSYYLSFGLPMVIARPFNTYGPRQTARAVIPTIASQLAAGKEQIRLGTLSPTRDFNYVEDTARGMISLALSERVDGETVNIGSGVEWSIGRVVELLSEIADFTPEIMVDNKRIRPKKSEVNRLLSNNEKIKKLTEWEPQVTFQKGLKRTYAWVKENLNLFDVDKYSK